MPELPAATRARYINEYGLSEYDANRLTETVDISQVSSRRPCSVSGVSDLPQSDR